MSREQTAEVINKALADNPEEVFIVSMVGGRVRHYHSYQNLGSFSLMTHMSDLIFAQEIERQNEIAKAMQAKEKATKQ